MRKLLLTASLLLVSSLHASPAEADDMDRFLAGKGLIDQPRQAQPAIARSVTNRASELVVAAMGALGVPYRRGGNTFDSGFDCSGFVKAMYQQTLGLILPRKASQQAAATQTIDRAELQPGDLVFFNTLHRAFSHVGIYVGDYKFIHSPRPGAAVRIEDMRVNYWNRRFDGARRVLRETATDTPAPASDAAPSAAPTSLAAGSNDAND